MPSSFFLLFFLSFFWFKPPLTFKSLILPPNENDSSILIVICNCCVYIMCILNFSVCYSPAWHNKHTSVRARFMNVFNTFGCSSQCNLFVLLSKVTWSGVHDTCFNAPTDLPIAAMVRLRCKSFDCKIM